MDRFGYVYHLAADEYGEIRLKMTPGPNHTIPTKFDDLGVMQIQEVPDPRMALLCGSGGGLVFLRPRRSHVL